MLKNFKGNMFLFSELIKRDFKKKYKNTYLGMIWSVLSPLLTLLVMYFVFSHFYEEGGGENFITYLFCGNIVFSFFSESTSGGMTTLLMNAPIFTKINVPKHLFLLSRNISSLINFGLTLVVFFIFCLIDGVFPTWHFLMLIVPILCLVIFNTGLGLILSALFVFFRDMQYLWRVFTQLIMYVSAIFYNPANIADGNYTWLFYFNPLYVYITYFRTVVLYHSVPSLELHVLAVAYALLALGVGALIYRANNHKFLYYV